MIVMEILCPCCNGIIEYSLICPDCGHIMEDNGSMKDYYGPYSPYLEQDEYEPAEIRKGDNDCIHLFHCPVCSRNNLVVIEKIKK